MPAGSFRSTPGAVGQSGCTLTAVMETEELGKSDPFTLGKVVRLPHIDSFAMTDEKSPEGFYGVLKGRTWTPSRRPDGTARRRGRAGIAPAGGRGGLQANSAHLHAVAFAQSQGSSLRLAAWGDGWAGHEGDSLIRLI